LRQYQKKNVWPNAAGKVGNTDNIQMVLNDLTIGILGLQGAFAKHIAMLQKLGVNALQVRYPDELDKCDGLILPGGESTTISKLLDEMNIRDRLLHYDRPMFGTCAGAILLSEKTGDPQVQALRRVAITSRRNAWGRQVDSFVSPITLSFEKSPFKAVFIRAPKLTKPGPEVKILGRFDGEIVLVQNGNILLSTFHPELTDDNRIHAYFIKQIIQK